jgi:hypothetical protein
MPSPPATSDGVPGDGQVPSVEIEIGVRGEDLQPMPDRYSADEQVGGCPLHSHRRPPTCAAPVQLPARETISRTFGLARSNASRSSARIIHGAGPKELDESTPPPFQHRAV